jgi:hypothetical protein
MPYRLEYAVVGEFNIRTVDAAVLALFCDEMLFGDLDFLAFGVAG